MNRLRVFFALLVCLAPIRALAQTPDVSRVLGLPASARVAALGNAWVAGRDQDVVFANPAQLVGVRPEFNLSLGHLGPHQTMGALTSAYAAGKLSFTLGWGGVLLTEGKGSAPSALGVVAGAVTFKGFRAGVSGKYVSQHLPSSDRHAWLCDVGLARNLFGGVAGAALQNVGVGSTDGADDTRIPRQLALGWSTSKQAGPLDLALFTQITPRKDHTSPAAGLKVGYGWIEGYLVTLRAGARRTGLPGERPLSVGAGFTADRLTIDYDAAGHVARQPLTRYGIARHPLDANLYRRKGRDAQRFTNIFELIPQTFLMPLEDFVQATAAFDPRRLATIRLLFDKTVAGTVVIEHIGVSPSPGGMR